MYVLKLDENNRILSISKRIEGKDYKSMPIVKKRPEDLVPADATAREKNARNYLYKNDAYIYDPLPEAPDPETQPSQLDMIEAQVTYTAMMTDTLLEV